MDNFDLRRYLIENKATTNSKLLTENEMSEIRTSRLAGPRKEYVKVVIGSRGMVMEVAEVEIKNLEEHLENRKKDIHSEMLNDMDDMESAEEYFEQFVYYGMNKKKTLGYISCNEEEIEYYINQAAYPKKTAAILEDVNRVTVVYTVSGLFQNMNDMDDMDYMEY